MYFLRTTAVIIGAGLMLSACASRPSVSENQCRAGDWQTIGYRDGAAGLQSTKLLAHQDACGEFGIVPNRSSYMAGWSEGLTAYCTADNGFNLGQRGAGMNNVCSGDLEEPFASAYADGRQLYVARAEVNRLNRKIARHEARLPQIKQEMIGVSTAQLTPDLSPEERIALLSKLDDLADERAAIKAELPVLHADLHVAEDDLNNLQTSLASVSY